MAQHGELERAAGYKRTYAAMAGEWTEGITAAKSVKYGT